MILRIGKEEKCSLVAVAFLFMLLRTANAFVPSYRESRVHFGGSAASVYSPLRDARMDHSIAQRGALNLWGNNDEIEGTDRIKACVPYILPLLDGDQFGKYIYMRIPPLGALNDFFLGPLVNIYHSIPFLGVGLFILLTLGTRFNTDMNRNVRFNAQQAALIDVALIFPELIASSFDDQPGLPRSIVEPCANFVWYAYMSAVVYSIFCNLRGKKPDQIPFISNYSELMVGPF